MKDHLLDLALAAMVVLMAFGHDAIGRLMVSAPTSLLGLVTK